MISQETQLHQSVVRPFDVAQGLKRGLQHHPSPTFACSTEPHTPTKPDWSIPTADLQTQYDTEICLLQAKLNNERSSHEHTRQLLAEASDVALAQRNRADQLEVQLQDAQLADISLSAKIRTLQSSLQNHSRQQQTERTALRDQCEILEKHLHELETEKAVACLQHQELLQLSAGFQQHAATAGAREDQAEARCQQLVVDIQELQHTLQAQQVQVASTEAIAAESQQNFQLLMASCMEQQNTIQGQQQQLQLTHKATDQNVCMRLSLQRAYDLVDQATNEHILVCFCI